MQEAATVRVNDIDLYYETHGEGEPLLLLHGLLGCSGDWIHAGRDELAKRFRLIAPDARGHGRSTNSEATVTHRQCALDVLALLDRLGIRKCKAIGMSLGGNTLLHVATLRPEWIEAMVLVSATPYFPEQARSIMRQVAAAPPEGEWPVLRERHRHGDGQIRALWAVQRSLAESYDDMNFTPPALSRIEARTLILYGDRDPLYPVELAVEMYRAIPRAALCVIPGAGHGPIFLGDTPAFLQRALGFLGSEATPHRS
jgi:pimeloyl-ACP methyl ester carboxylesterase